MLNRELILELFNEINEELRAVATRGELGIVGGAAMCLVFESRLSTKDVDGVFAPTSLLRTIIETVGQNNGLESDWLNDAAKGYLNENLEKEIFINLSHLTIWSPTAEYLLAMKAISARADSFDAEDIEFLIRHLAINQLQVVLDIVEKFYPKQQIPSKTQFFIEEILEKIND